MVRFGQTSRGEGYDSQTQHVKSSPSTSNHFWVIIFYVNLGDGVLIVYAIFLFYYEKEVKKQNQGGTWQFGFLCRWVFSTSHLHSILIEFWCKAAVNDISINPTQGYSVAYVRGHRQKVGYRLHTRWQLFRGTYGLMCVPNFTKIGVF